MIAPPWGYKQHGSGPAASCTDCGHFAVSHPHREGCRTAALESTAEAMARALESVQFIHDGKGRAIGYGASEELVLAALASWRSLTGASARG